MSLSILELPPLLRFRATNWRQTGGVIYNRSEFTGRTQALRIGPAARWTCELEITPSQDPTYIDQVRSFLAVASRPEFAFRIFMADQPQSPTALAAVNGAGQLGDNLNIDGLPPSTTVLSPGAIITVQYAPIDEQPCVLLTPLVSNASGQATAFLATPLRRSPTDNAIVRISVPVAIMRLRDATSYNVAPAQVHDWPRFTAEEAF